MSWSAEASRGRGGRSTEEGEGFFAEGAHTRGGHVGKRLASNIAGGATFQTDPNATDEGIFDDKRGMRGGFAGKDNESSIGPGFAIRHNKGDEGIFDETRKSKFSGRAGETSIEVSEGGLIGKKGTAIEGIFADGPRKNIHAGRDAVTHIRGGDGGFYGVGAVNEGIFAEGPRKNKFAGTGLRRDARPGVHSQGRVFGRRHLLRRSEEKQVRREGQREFLRAGLPASRRARGRGHLQTRTEA
jgi:hypothetical protein